MTISDWILQEIANDPGITARGLAVLYRGGEAVLGYYAPVSRAIARLRAAGFIKDVAKRCDKCGGALTRGQRDVPLHLTGEGWKRAMEVMREEAA